MNVMAGRSKYSLEQKTQAVTLASVLQSTERTAQYLDPPQPTGRTIRNWIRDFELWGDSDMEAFISKQRKLANGLWAVAEVDNLTFATELRAAGKAKDVQHATTAAAIANTKLTGQGQPKAVDSPSSKDLIYLDPPPPEPPDEHSTHES